MPRKPLDALEGLTLASAGLSGFFDAYRSTASAGSGAEPQRSNRMQHTRRVRNAGRIHESPHVCVSFHSRHPTRFAELDGVAGFRRRLHPAATALGDQILDGP